MDWVRKVQAEVGLKDAADPRLEMVHRMKAYPRLVSALKRRILAPGSAEYAAAKGLLRDLGEMV